MAQDLAANPFAQLFASTEVATEFSEECKQTCSAPPDDHPNDSLLPETAAMKPAHSPSKINEEKMLEEILAVTLHKNQAPEYVYLGDTLSHLSLLNLDNFEEVLYERLAMENPAAVAAEETSQDDGHGHICCPLLYMLHCYRKAQVSWLNAVSKERIVSALIGQSASILLQPDILLEGRNPGNFADIYWNHYNLRNEMGPFMTAVADQIVQDGGSISDAFGPSLKELVPHTDQLNLMDSNIPLITSYMQLYTQNQSLALVLLAACTPENKSHQGYLASPLGRILAVSCIPDVNPAIFGFFNDLYTINLNQDRNQQVVWERLSEIHMEVFQLFKSLLRLSQETKARMLGWIRDCLAAFQYRSKLWPATLVPISSADGLLVNLECVLLRLCEPFISPNHPKLMAVEPRLYTTATGAPKETGLVPNSTSTTQEEQQWQTSSSSGGGGDRGKLVTELYYQCHRAIHVGSQLCQDILTKLAQELARLQRLLQDASQQFTQQDPFMNDLRSSSQRKLCVFLSYKMVLLEPKSLELRTRFHVASATWLLPHTTPCDPPTFPLPPPARPDQLAHIPEYFLEDIADHVIFLKRHDLKSLELAGPDLNHLFSLVLVLMGSPERVFNPHLRAKLAMMLEGLLPTLGESTLPRIHLERIFCEHPHVSELVPVLLHVFVSIEATGHSVSFEQKFQYRSPMYTVLRYCWNITVHRETMKRLAREAEEGIESPDPPIFLRFINLLINDANFLLDEALSCMVRLRELQAHEQPLSQEDQASLSQTAMLARFHNAMSNESIYTLQWLTSQIRSIFCHPAIVDRITAMLNYFLLHLVGPDKKKLRVKDMEQYEFKPKNLLRDISQIYIHLGLPCDTASPQEKLTAEEFCRAVSRDGRSYSPTLFPLASETIRKVYAGFLAVKMDSLAEKVQALAETQQREEELLGEDIPDEFLDPIISTVMKDPVILPSSGVRVDRATIARHLLSDQTDPFNRSPLTMDQVIPDSELHSRIQKWLAEKSAASPS